MEGLKRHRGEHSALGLAEAEAEGYSSQGLGYRTVEYQD